ncbi:MAG: hypoxanthine-guanine phosphoribosyltransferase [Dokdonella sp.]
MSVADYQAALARAELIHDEAAIQSATQRMAGEIDAQLGDESALFITVMNGGMIFAGQLAPMLQAPVQLDYLHASRYRGETSGGELNWLARPHVEMCDRTVLLVDDILDEGYTLQAIRKHCIDLGARRVLIAVLCEKTHGRVVPGLVADFVGLEVPDRYVFGYGMDYHELGRNLPAIHAL